MVFELIKNEHIRAKTVRLVENETTVGVISLNDALYRARARNLDLVVVAEGEPPVVRILDADRYRYERTKLERELAKKQRELVSETKEIQLRPVTDSNDIAIKARKARAFLDEGNKVRVIVRFKGREKSHREQGDGIIEQFIAKVGEHKIEKPISLNDGDMILLLGPILSKAEIKKNKTKETEQRFNTVAAE